MNDAKTKQQIVEKITGSTNVLVTVSKDPSVDALSAALGLTVMLNKLGKHTTAIFSGATPPAITFLDPQKTFESSIDSLRDFIIALDKEKADHLRYKVEGDAVKIFITPYRTTLSSEDLEFSQGDYNIELVLALGVENQSHLDAALEAHGSILHDATVITISTEPGSSSLGSVDWRDETASSLSEMLVTLSETLASETPLIDQQVATALLTGIVAETDRFSNTKTSSKVMTISAQLMAAGADQQLIASKLQESHEIGAGATPTGNASPYTQTLAQSAQSPTKEGMVITHDEVVPIASTSPVSPAPVPDQSSLPPVTPSPSVPPIPVDVPPVTVGKIADAYAFQPDEVTTDTATTPPPTAPLLGGVAPTAEPAATGNDVAPLSPIAPPQPSTPAPTPTPAPTTPSDALAPATLGSLPPAPAEVTAPMSTEISKHSYLGGAPSTYDTPVNGAPAPAGEGGVDIFAAPAPTTMDGNVPSITPPAPTSPALGTRDEASRNDALAAVHATFDQPAAQPFSPAPGITLPPPPPLPDFGALPQPTVSPYALDPLPTQPAPERLGDILAPEAAPVTTTPPPQSAPNDPGQFQIPGQ
jgi:hypothetical protein